MSGSDKDDKTTVEVENTKEQQQFSADYLHPVTITETGGEGLPAVKANTRGLQPPEFLLHMTMEKRLELEGRL